MFQFKNIFKKKALADTLPIRATWQQWSGSTIAYSKAKGEEIREGLSLTVYM